VRTLLLNSVLCPKDHFTELLSLAFETIAVIPGVEGARVKIVIRLLEPEEWVVVWIEHAFTLSWISMLDWCYVARVYRFEDMVRVALKDSSVFH
jgi:hypothetical protein